MMKSTVSHKQGFTLLELLIVIAIIAILSVALVLVINPSETLKKSRDAQRMSDLATLKRALGLYMTNTATPYLDVITSNATCKTNPTDAWSTGKAIFYSMPGATLNGYTTLDGVAIGAFTNGGSRVASLSTATLVDGNGWIPVDFSHLTGGSPISNLPVDPINMIANPSGNITSADLVYRYACATNPLAFEIDATLESLAYTSTENKNTADGGNSTYYYEVGTDLHILGSTLTGVDF